jgi:adenylyl-sulfate kinase
MTTGQAPIIWLTGMSGSGKTTLSSEVKTILQKQRYTVRIVDGDDVRNNYTEKLGFNRNDVMKNNVHIAQKCQDLRAEYDVIFVPVISPYNEIRTRIRTLLSPNFHLIYLKTDIDSLIERDPKGLYKLAADGLIKDLIGYSEATPYEQPDDAELTIETNNENTINTSTMHLIKYIHTYVTIPL